MLADPEIREIRKLFQELLETDEVSKFNVTELLQLLQPESLLERFAAKKATNNIHPKDFVNVQGSLQGQIENKEVDESSSNNEFVGFKCSHYSVTESNGAVEIRIEKRTQNSEYSFGVRAVSGTAKEGTDFETFDKQYTFKSKEKETKI